MILGIDGGGTKTKFLLCNNDGEAINEYITTTLHYQQIGYQSFGELIMSGITHTLPQNKNISDLDFITFGIPGWGESKEDTKKLQDILSKIINCPFEAVNDVKLAWAGALACKPGICILSGTGSMAYAIDENNNELRCGGWGYRIGDEGSAYWLGHKACETFCKMSDGRLEKGPLYHIFMKELQLKYDFDLINYVNNITDHRKDIANLTLLLAKAALQKDEQALECFKSAARELSLLVKGILINFVHTQQIIVSYLGGVFNAGDFFIEYFKAELQKYSVHIESPKLSSAQGACLYAAKKLNLHTDKFYKRLTNEKD